MTRIYTHERADSLNTFRGIINGLIIVLIGFWLPVIALLIWWLH